MLIGSAFKITDKEARIREQVGSNFPFVVQPDGKFKLIPKGELVTIEAFNINGLNRLDYVKVRDFGWTARTNFEFGLLNEIVDTILPGFFSEEPGHFTVVDENTLIRKKQGANFPVSHGIIPIGELLILKKSSPDKQFVQVAFTRRSNNSFEEDPNRAPVWTKAGNLNPGWFDPHGLNSIWEKGLFKGLKPLHRVVGGDGEVGFVVADFYEFFRKMVDAARRDNISIQLTSGFRTWQKQQQLRRNFENHVPGFNLAAKPGRSNHQNGIAFDLNTGHDPVGPVFDWLTAHAAEFGFIRTVRTEPWHWEYHPDEAAQHRAVEEAPENDHDD